MDPSVCLMNGPERVSLRTDGDDPPPADGAGAEKR
jgi:hypothetical protein